ncbi:MAG: PAS domain S-box protein [Sphingomonadaceae bacterium]|nr:PAS domain S-box protein [Sphingomonadaceae bacterium]
MMHDQGPAVAEGEADPARDIRLAEALAGIDWGGDERHARALLGALPVAVYTTDAEGRITYYNQAAVELSGRRPELGSDRWCVTWKLYLPDGTPLAHDQCPMAIALRENRPVRGVEAIAERPDGACVPFLPYPTPLRDETGRLVGAINTLVDISERKQADRAIRESEARFREQFENANDFIFTADLKMRLTSCNPAVTHALGVPLEALIGHSVSEFVPAAAAERNRRILSARPESRQSVRYEAEVNGPDGEVMVWEISSRLTRDPDGTPNGFHGIGRDITERKRDERRLRLLVDELNHRVKNTLAIVQSLAHQSFQGDDASGARASFQGRLVALAGAHNLLTSRSWESAELGEVVETALGGCAADCARFSIHGPPVPLHPQSAVTLSMALHELCTNAAKYGAFSTPEGHVDVSWSVSDNDEPMLSLRWEESGGPSVAAPARSGFGRRMIERALAYELRGRARLDFRGEGLVCEIEAPLARLAGKDCRPGG